MNCTRNTATFEADTEIRRLMKRLVFVTGNACKLSEVMTMLKEVPVEVVNAPIDLPELQGDPVTICLEKARAAFEKVGAPVIVEDTSLEFAAYKGLPGPYIKYFLKNLTAAGLPRMLDAFVEKSAVARTIFGFCDGDRTLSFSGICEGQVVEARGAARFGWDPIFQPDGFTETYAEMSVDTKNMISHRSRALAKLVEFLVCDF